MSEPGRRSAGAFDERALAPPPLPEPFSCASASAAQVERRTTVAALRPLGFRVVELDRLLAILEELDEGRPASDRCGGLLDELERFCNRAQRFAPAADLPARQALAALRRRHEQLAAAAGGPR